MPQDITVYGHGRFSKDFQEVLDTNTTIALTKEELGGKSKTLKFNYVDCETATNDMCSRISLFPTFVHGDSNKERFFKGIGDASSALKSTAIDIANALGPENNGCTEVIPSK